MRTGASAGIFGMVLLLMFVCSGQGADKMLMAGLVVVGAIAWGIRSAVKYGNGGFFAGLIISVGTLLLIFGVGVALVCGHL